MPDTLLTDPKSVLDPISVDNTVKANAWDAYSQSTSQDDFKARFDKLAIPDNAKADLWDMKFGGGLKALSTPLAPKTTLMQDALTDPRMNGALMPQIPTAPIAPGMRAVTPRPRTREEMAASAPGAPAPALPDELKTDAQLQSEMPVSRNSRTGLLYQAAPYGQSILDFPYTAPKHILHGIEALAAPAESIHGQEGERELQRIQLLQGLPLTPLTPIPPGTGKQISRGAHELATGAFEAMTPLMAAGMVEAPLYTAVTLAAGIAAQKGVAAGAKAFGVAPEYADFAGDIAALLAGYATAKIRFSPEQANLIETLQGKGTGTPAGDAARIEKLRTMADRGGTENERRLASLALKRSFGIDYAFRPDEVATTKTAAPATTKTAPSEPTAAPPEQTQGVPPPPSPTETFLRTKRENPIPLTTDQGPAFLQPTLEFQGDQHVVITDEMGEPLVQGPPAMVAQWMEAHAQRGAQAPTTPAKSQPVVNAAEFVRAHNAWNSARIKAVAKYMQDNPGADEATATPATQGTYGIEPQMSDYKAPPAPPEAAEPEVEEAPKPPKVGKVSSATPNAPTAATPTEPESPETIAIQVQQLGQFGQPVQPGIPQRRVVMFPGGQGMDLQALGDLAITNDGLGNTYAYRKDLISASEIKQAAKNNTLAEILGHHELGMGVPDKSEQQEEGLAVTAHAPDGTEVQTAVSPTDNIPAAIEAAHAVTPEGGHVTVTPPPAALAERQGIEPPETLSDGQRKWVTGEFNGRQFPLQAKNSDGNDVTVMGPAYPDAAGGIDPHQLYVRGRQGDYLTTAANAWLPKPGREGSTLQEHYDRMAEPRDHSAPSLLEQAIAGHAAPSATPKAMSSPKLPAELAGAKPRYSYGPKQFELEFLNDIDRAAYIAAQATPSKRDGDYLKFAMDATGASAEEVRTHGARVRDEIKRVARNATNKTITVMDMASGAFATPPIAEPVPAEQTGIKALVDAIYQKLQSGVSLGNITDLNRLGEKYLGGARASGEWTPKDLFDAMEAAVNRYLIDNGAALLAEDGIAGLQQLRQLMSRLTTQSIRTDEQLANQQFSTPPTLSYVVAKVANLHPDDVVLEPSAGNGGIAAWPKSIGATVFTNEISPRRREMLEAAGLGGATAHDGELINALLDRSIQPTVVLMNPPFSASTLKSHTAKNNNTYGFNHVESALQRLVPNGRLVVILGGGQVNEPEGGASFTGKKAGDWFRKIADRYNIRANVRINGKEYYKYGTSFATRIIVIDKNGPTVPTPESRFGNAVRLNVDTLEQAYEALRAIAADRPTALRDSVSGGSVSPTSAGASGGVEPATVPGDRTSVTGSESGTGTSPTSGAGGTGITGIPPRSGQDSDGSELAGGLGAVPGPPERVQPETSGGGSPQQQSDVRPPRHNEPEPATGPGAVDQHADEQQQVGPTGVDSSELDSIIDDVAAGLEALIGKAPAPKPSPKAAPKRVAKSPEAAPAPKVNPLEQAAIDAERDLRALLGDIPNMSVSDQVQQKAQIDRAILTKLGIIGGKHILDGAVKFDDWGEKMKKQVGDLIHALSQTSKLPAPEILRQIHMVASAAAKRFGVEAEATPPESEFFPTGDRLNLERQESTLVHEEDTDAYVKYQPTLKGPQHPGDIVETKTMATVPLPIMTYRPALPQAVIDNGTISNVQLEGIAMVGQQNDILLPGGYRASALIGDGTGVGKGREAAGILWDNWRQGRRRLVWVSEKNDLMQDAARDFSGLGAGSDILANVTQAANGRWIFNPNSRMKTLASWNGRDEIKHEGVIFVTYALLRSENKKGGTRAEQLRKWLDGDDKGDGAYILFDEAHNLKNAVPSIGSVGSKTGIRARQLLADIPGLRSASLSATAATEISNLGYLDRLGLWGPGTSFPGGFMDFQTAIGSGRMAAMELVARELKAQGKYISRTLSFKGVTQDTVTHELNEDQKTVYRTAAHAWQQVFKAAQKTITDTNNGGKEAKSRFNSEFRSAQLRFFNVLLSTLKIPTAVKLAEESLAAGKSVVITLVNTNEAAQNREKEKMSARNAQKVIDGDEENEEDEQEYDFGPKEMLVNLIQKNYPVQQWADDVDPNGKTIKVPVYTIDADGNRVPVTNPQAEAERDALIAEINRDLHMPGNPLDVLIEALGGRTTVAELTGRKERYDEATGKFISRGDPGTARKDINIAEMKKFQNGDKRIAVLSSAAGTGISLHADKGAKNQQKRVQITLQVGWSADKQMQMFGRTHRTNQAHAPEYIMLVSDLGGEKRFIATIARRLGSLGALTKGQKNASAGADMMDKVNFETDQGRAAARVFYESLQKNIAVPGSTVTGLEVLRYLGVGREDEDSGEIEISDTEKRNVTRLLNRLLALDPDLQNAFYEYYYDLFGANVRAAIEDGTLDTGVKALPGDVINVKQEQLLATDPQTGAKTFYYPVDSQSKTERISPENLDKKITFHKDENPRILRSDKGKVALAINAHPIVRANGSVDEAARVVTPGNATWRKVSLAELTRLNMQPVGEWAAERHHELQTALEKATREAEHAQRRYDEDLAYQKERLADTAKAALKRAESDLFRYTNGYEQAPLIVSGEVWRHGAALARLQGAVSRHNQWQVTDNAQNRQILADLRGISLSGGNRLVLMSDVERLARVPEAESAIAVARRDIEAAVNAPVTGDSWYASSLKTAQESVAQAQAEVTAHAPIVADPTAWAKAQWVNQYDASPSHSTDEYHLIGGAVLKYWNAIREASPLLDIYTTVDSNTGQRIVGVSVMPQTVNQLIARITGGRATVTTGQMLRDVLINGTPFNLEGGIRVVRGRVAKTPVLQFMASNDAALRNLKSLGVVTERGITPVHYLPTDASKQSQILREILKAYPVIQEDIGEAPAFSIEAPRGWSTQEGENDNPVLARYRDGVIYTTREGMRAIGNLWGRNLKGAQLPRSTQNYAIAAHLTSNPRTEKLGLMIRAHANEPRGLIVVATGQGIGALKSLLRHERFHRTQQGLPLHLNMYEKAFMRHPLAQRTGTLLTKLGYPVERHSLEIGADLAAGEFQRLGLTRDEGRTLARVYFGALRAEHGDEAVDRIVDTGIVPAITKEARERAGKQETTLRPASTNTGGTGSNPAQYALRDSDVEGDEGGVRRLVRQDISEGTSGTDRLKLEPAPTGPSSITLGSGFGALQPGLEALYDRDLKPAAKAVTKTVAGGIDDLKKVFAPDLRGPAAQKAMGLLRERGGERDQRRDRALALLKGMKKRFLQMPEEQGFRGKDIWNAIETGQITGLSPIDLKFARAARSLLDARWSELNKLGLLNTYIENYLPRSWKDPKAAESWAQSWQSKRPMAGREDFRRRRTYPTMQEGLDDPDFTLVPKFDNPVDMLMATLGQMDASITANRVVNEGRAKGDMVYVPAGTKPPLGLEQLDDKIFKVAGPPRGAVTIDPASRSAGGKQEPKPLRSDFGHGPGRWDLTPEELGDYQEAQRNWRDENVQPEDIIVHGQRVMGHYYAVEPYARVINNDLSRGIDGTAFMGGVRAVNNFMNAMELSLSYYHGLTTTLNSSFSDMALGIEQALAGKPGKAAVSIGRGLLPFASAVHDVYKGTKLLKAWDMQPEEFKNLRQTDPVTWAITDALKAAGAKARQDSYYQKQFVDALKDEWSRGNHGGALLRAIPAVAEILMKPIMEYMVPRVKLSAFAKLAAEALQNNPTFDRDELRQVMGQIQNTVDNRFGQMVQRNLMMHALARGAMNAVIGRPGWNLGSVQEILGGVMDFLFGNSNTNTPGIAGNIDRVLHGRAPKISHKTAYLLALLIGGAIINALTSFILTGGDAPEGWDYIAPRDGGVTEDGRPSRIILPTYLAKDIYSYATRPRETLIAKTAPLLSLTAELFRNRDFYDRKIYGERSIGLLKYLASELAPYSLTGLQKNRERHASLGKQFLPMVGIMPASKRVGLSQAERMIADYLDEGDAKTRAPSGDRDKAKVDVFLTARTNERKAYTLGEEYVRAGKLAPADVTRAIGRARQRPLVADYRHVSDFPTAMRIYDAASPDEKKLLKQDALHKANLAASRPWEWNDTGARNIAWKYFNIGPGGDTGPAPQRMVNPGAPQVQYPMPLQ